MKKLKLEYRIALSVLWISVLVQLLLLWLSPDSLVVQVNVGVCALLAIITTVVVI